jgi:vacuolar protein sorting-associated protein 13A/C
MFIVLSCVCSSDVVWEFKPKKKSRWKPLSFNYAALLETHFREYTESGSVDNAILDLESNFQVRQQLDMPLYSIHVSDTMYHPLDILPLENDTICKGRCGSQFVHSSSITCVCVG